MYSSYDRKNGFKSSTKKWTPYQSSLPQISRSFCGNASALAKMLLLYVVVTIFRESVTRRLAGKMLLHMLVTLRWVIHPGLALHVITHFPRWDRSFVPFYGFLVYIFVSGRFIVLFIIS